MKKTRNPNKDSLHNIKKWLSKQETDEPIPSKSKDRVLTSMAKSIRKIKPLPRGRCDYCANYTEKLTPIPAKICLKCAKKILKNTGTLKVTKKTIETYYCDLCLTKTFATLTTTLNLCPKCVRKIGLKHKHELKDMKHQQQLDKQKIIKKFYTTLK